MAAYRSALMKILKILLLLVVVLVLAGLGFLKYSGAWGAFFPSSEHDTVAPALPTNLGSPALLVFSKTNGFRHEEGIAGGGQALAEIAADNNWGLYATENGAVFNQANLARFDVVVFLSASGDMLNTDQEQAFQAWMEAGGGWLGIHAAGDGSHARWRWYMDNLIGAEFTAHPLTPQFQNALVIVEGNSHQVMQAVPDTWNHVEEWYSWASSPRERGFNILATLDEESYSPIQKFLGQERDLHMGDHPVVWSNCVGSGRSVYAAMGHKAEAFTKPEFRQILENALMWMIRPTTQDCQNYSALESNGAEPKESIR
jgi:type 1 glutamine amidotransferase